jgi:hypothetical protein
VRHKLKVWLTIIDIDEFTGSGDLGKVNLRSYPRANSQIATKKNRGKMLASPKSDRNRHTDVIQVHDLIIANLGVFWVGGNDEFVTSGYRDLQEELKIGKE